MITELQKEALAVLAEVVALSPDVRLGQLFTHLGFLGEMHLDKGLGYIEDDEILAVLYRHRTELRSRLPGASETSETHPSEPLSVSGSPTEAVPS